MKNSIIFTLCLFLAFPAMAQNKQQRKKTEIKTPFNFAPSRIELDVEAGKKTTQKIVISNISDSDLTAEIKLIPVKVSKEGTIVKENEIKTAKNSIELPTAIPFISISEKQILVKKKQTKEVVLSIAVPDNAEGTYYFLYTVRPTVESDKKFVKENLKNAGIGIKLSYTLPGHINIKGKTSPKVESKSKVSHQKDKLIIQSEVENVGNTILKGVDSVATIVKEGKVVGKVDLKGAKSKVNLVNKTKAAFVGILPKSLEKGKYSIVITTKDFITSTVATEKLELDVK